MIAKSIVYVALIVMVAQALDRSNEDRIDFENITSMSDVVIIGTFVEIRYLDVIPQELFVTDSDKKHDDLRSLGYQAVKCKIAVDCQLKGDCVGGELVFECLFYEEWKNGAVKLRGAFRGPQVILVDELVSPTDDKDTSPKSCILFLKRLPTGEFIPVTGLEKATQSVWELKE